MEENGAVRKVRTKWVIDLPVGATVLVKTGDVVACDQILVQTKTRAEKMIDLTPEYGKLSATNWEQLKTKLLGLTIKEGEFIFGEESVFGKRPKALISGKIDKIDEFRNVYVQLPAEINKNIYSPVNAKVSKIDDQNLVLEFRTEEYPGVGLTEGKVWGRNGLKFAEHMTDLSVRDSGRVILVDELLPAMLVKAKVVGIVGVVVIDSGVNDDKINSDLPILKVDGDKFFRLRKYAVDEDMRVLLNASSGRLLLCQK